VADPTTVTIPGATEGLNCRLTVGGYGVFLCRTLRLTFSLNILSNEGEAATRRAFYPWVTSGSSFDMAVIHKTWEEREVFNAWVKGYMDRVAANQRISGSMKIEVPARRFHRVGVCQGSLAFGDKWDAPNATRLTTLSFVGASEPISVAQGDTAGTSYYKAPKVEAALGQHFYPSGRQVSGAESLEGTLFDATPTEDPAVTRADLMDTYRMLSAAGVIKGGPANFIAMSGG
jgi:hypothetical protein